jgi:acetyl esterase/lipase
MKQIEDVVSLIPWLWVARPAAAADVPTVVELWPGKVPDEAGTIGPETVRMSPKHTRNEVEVTEPTRLVTNVSKPTLTLHRPPKEKDTGAAILICPGGGYWDLYWELEGEEVAAWLTGQGVTGIILKYRVPRRPDEPKGEPARRPLQDAQRAVSLVRSKAKEWGIDPDRIGMVGISMGGIQTWLAGAADVRVRVAVPAIAVQSFRWSLDHDRWQGRANTIREAHEAAAADLGEPAVNRRVCRELSPNGLIGVGRASTWIASFSQPQCSASVKMRRLANSKGSLPP